MTTPAVAPVDAQVSCSVGSLSAGESLAGTAPPCLAWLLLEQNGPWGLRAFTESHLDPDLGRSLERSAGEHQTRPSLIRRPGRHPDHQLDPDRTHADPRHVLVAFTHPQHTWLLEGIVERPDALLNLDWTALEAGDVEAVRRSLPSLVRTDRPHLLVCTNGTRDVCCASLGRPIALGASRRYPDQVWEVTHTSGHRFAPTSVLLPSGTLHGRLDLPSADGVLDAAEKGCTVLAGSRGRSTWTGPAQVAELAVRDLTGELSLTGLTVTDHQATDARRWVTEVAHEDGRTWRVEVEARASDVRRAETCGKSLKPMTYYLTSVTPGSVPV